MFINLQHSNFSIQNSSAIQINDGLLMDKIKIKNFYPKWTGENITELQNKHDIKNMLRVGTPLIDDELRKDRVFFILEFLSYNPVNSQIEKRILCPQRIMNKLYIGQSPDEEKYKDADVIINGKLVVKEFLSIKSTDDFKHLNNKIKALESEITLLKARVRDIYKQDEYVNKVSSRNNSSRGAR